MSGNGLRVEVEVPACVVVVQLHDREDWVTTYGTNGDAVADDVRETVLTATNPGNVKDYGAFGSGEVEATITITPPVPPRLVSVTLDDGRVVDVFASGTVQVYTPDKRHGAEFKMPPGVELGGSFGMLTRRLG